MNGREPIEHANPRSVLEEEEESAADSGESRRSDADWMRRVMTWILDGKNMVAVATRAYVAAYVASPDVVQGMTLHQIAKLSGKGRSAAHNLASEFEERFGVTSIHARSAEARAKYAAAYRARNNSAPHAYNPLKSKQS